jgi:hypothetical protein
MSIFSKYSQKKETVIGAGIFLWIGIVFYHYFSWALISDFSFVSTVIAGFNQASLLKMAANGFHFLKTLCIALGAAFILWRAGRRLVGWFGLSVTHDLVRFCVEMAFGIVLLNGLWLGLGLNGLWWPTLLGLLVLTLLAFALWDFFHGFLKIQKLPRFRFPGKLYLALGGLGLFCFLLDLSQGWVPDVYFDALVYHLSTLEFWKYHHGIADFYTNLYSYYPFGGELYFFNGYFFGGSEAAKLLNAFAAGLCGLAAAGWVAEETNLESGWLTWAIVLTIPLVSATVWTTQNDVLLAFFFILFYYALARWAAEVENWKWAVTAGVLGGGALTLKYTAVVGVVAGLLAICFTYPETLRMRHWPRWGVIKGLIFLSLAPWLFKNFAYTGNPFYPYLSSWIGGIALSPGKIAALMGDHESPFLGGFSFTGWVGHVLGSLDKTIGPLLFSFLSFLFLPGKGRPLVKYLAVLSGLLLTGGFLLSYQLRLMIPAFLVCFLFAVLFLSGLKKPIWSRLWAWVVVLFGLFSLLSLCRLSVNYYHSDKIWFGEESRLEYLNQAPQTSSYFGLAQLTGDLLPPDAQLLVVGDARGLYYPRPFYTNSVFDEQVLPILAREERDEDGIRKRLLEMGIDAMVVSGEEGKRLYGKGPVLPPQNSKKLDLFIQRWTDPLVLKGGSGIYLLRSQPAEGRGPIPDFLRFYQAGS